jgi:general secretion pathway protein D
MKERQQFVEQFYGASTAYDVAIDFARKPGPLARMNQLLNKELRKVENGGPGGEGERVIKPTGPEPVPGGAPSGTAPSTGPAPTPVIAPEGTPVPVQEPNPEILKVQPELE